MHTPCTHHVHVHAHVHVHTHIQTLISVIVFPIWGAGFVYLGMLALRAVQDVTKEVAQGGGGLRVVGRGWLDNLEALPYLPLVSTILAFCIPPLTRFPSHPPAPPYTPLHPLQPLTPPYTPLHPLTPPYIPPHR